MKGKEVEEVKEEKEEEVWLWFELVWNPKCKSRSGWLAELKKSGYAFLSAYERGERSGLYALQKRKFYVHAKDVGTWRKRGAFLYHLFYLDEEGEVKTKMEIFFYKYPEFRFYDELDDDDATKRIRKAYHDNKHEKGKVFSALLEAALVLEEKGLAKVEE